MPQINTAFILLAAGSARRMNEEKLLMRFGGKTPIEYCAEAIAGCKTAFSDIIVAVSPATKSEAERVFSNGKIIFGGSERSESVRNALSAIDNADIVVIHDAARCLVTPEIIDESVAAALCHGSGVAAVLARDTIWYDGSTIDRSKAMLAQTPQTFLFERIKRAYDNNVNFTDDCSMYKAAGYEPFFSAGGILNQKLTYQEDIPFFEAVLGARE